MPEEDKWTFQATISAEALASKFKSLRTFLQEHDLLWQKKHTSNENVIVATHVSDKYKTEKIWKGWAVKNQEN